MPSARAGSPGQVSSLVSCSEGYRNTLLQSKMFHLAEIGWRAWPEGIPRHSLQLGSFGGSWRAGMGVETPCWTTPRRARSGAFEAAGDLDVGGMVAACNAGRAGILQNQTKPQRGRQTTAQGKPGLQDGRRPGSSPPGPTSPERATHRGRLPGCDHCSKSWVVPRGGSSPSVPPPGGARPSRHHSVTRSRRRALGA